MKKFIVSICMMCFCAASNAQGTFTKPFEDEEQPRRGLFDRKKKKQAADQAKVNEVLGQNNGEKKRRGLFDSGADEVIDEKYLAGACPEVNGRIQWDKNIEVPGMKARDMYDKMLKFLKVYVKEKGKTEASNVSVVNEPETQIGARIQEWVVFENKPLSLDRTKFNYQLIVTCRDGVCTLSMRNMSFIYEEERGGGQMPAEDMISDAEALNKTKKGFKKGGHKKFRMKTIDARDAIFARVDSFLNDKK